MNGIQFFRHIPDNLEQNIYLQYTIQPALSVTEDSVTGIATFSAECRAYLPSGAEAGGTISFDWYLDDELVVDTTEDPTSDASIESTANNTSLTLTNITPQQDEAIIYVLSTYTPAPGEANAINSPLKSRNVTLKALSEIIILEQPINRTAASNNPVVFSTEAEVVPPKGQTINYQWQLNYEDLVDGTFNTGAFTNETTAGRVLITSDVGESVTLDLSLESLSTYSEFISGRTYTITALDGDIETRVYGRGAGGGTSSVRSVRGGNGGSAQGRFTFVKDQPYILRVGGRGLNGGEGGAGGYSGGGTGGGGHGRGGGGGGFTGLFMDSITQSNAILIAGGAGGGSNDPASGGNGGGLSGNPGSNGGRAGQAGTQSGGGSGAGGGQSGTALQGGTGAAGGGGGYFGGGGGQYVNGCCADGAGGGGSGFLNTTLLTNSSFSDENIAPGGGAAQDGSFKIDFITTIVPLNVSVSGANTPDLTLTTADVNLGGIIRCKLTTSNVKESPVYTRAVNYDVVNVDSFERSFLNYEIVRDDQAILLDKGSKNIFEDPLEFNSSVENNRQTIVVFAPEKDIEVYITLEGAAGQNVGSRTGGKGGKSIFGIILKQNTEYVFKIGPALEPYGGRGGGGGAAFFYEKGQLLAVVGGGGGAGGTANGGAGGGIGLAGGNGSIGSGGGIIPAGTLSVTGVEATGRNGGRVESCTQGDFYQSQGISPCVDVGLTEFTIDDGTTVAGTDTIQRGYKAGGISNRNNGGNSSSVIAGTFVGGGGAGVNGGGATDRTNASGGGGSGYTNGTVQVLLSQIGQNDTQFSRVSISLPFPIAPPITTEDVVWNVTREAAFSNRIVFRRQSGNGPETITWGPNSGQVVTSIQKGSVYVLQSNDGRLRLRGNTLQLEDSNDNDFNDLTVTPNKGRFTSTNRYEF